jgi:hypothetical protein
VYTTPLRRHTLDNTEKNTTNTRYRAQKSNRNPPSFGGDGYSVVFENEPFEPFGTTYRLRLHAKGDDSDSEGGGGGGRDEKHTMVHFPTLLQVRPFDSMCASSRAVAKLFVVPAWALPVPVSEGYIGLHRRAQIAIFLRPSSAVKIDSTTASHQTWSL